MLRFAQIAVLAFVFTVPWEDAVLLPGIGTGSRLAGIIAVPLALIGIVATGVRRTHPMLIWMLLFCCWAAFTIFWAADPDDTVLRLITYAQLAVMVWVLLQVLDRPAAVRYALLAYVLGSYVSAIATIQAYAAGLTVVYQRYAGLGFDPNDLGLTLALGVAMAWYLLLTDRGWLRLVPLGFLPLGLLAILLTASRSAALAAAIACILPFLLVDRPRTLALYVLPAAAVVLTVVVQYVPDTSLERIGTVWQELASGDLNYRTSLWGTGLELLAESPILGVGSGNFDNALAATTGQGRPAHNVFIAVLVEQGLVGFALFCGVLASVLYGVWQLPRREWRFWCMLYAVLLVAFMTLNWEWRKQTWMMLALGAAHASAVVRVQTRQPQPQILSEVAGRA